MEDKKQQGISQSPVIAFLMKIFNNPTIMGVVIGLVVAASFSVLLHFKALDNFEQVTLKWRFKYIHSNSKASDNCVVLAVDQESIKALGTWPWSRSVYVKLLDALELYGVKSVSFDIFFFNTNTHDPSADLDFARKLKSLDNVVLATNIIQMREDVLKEKGLSLDNISKQFKNFAIDNSKSLESPHVKDIYASILTKEGLKSENIAIFPQLLLKEIFENVSYIGLANINHEDETVIKTPLFIEYEDKYYPSLPLAAYMAGIRDKKISSFKGGIKLGDGKKIPTVEDNQFIVDWYPYNKRGNIYNTFPVSLVINAYNALLRVSESTGLTIEEVQSSIDYYYSNNCDQDETKCDQEKIAAKKLIDDANEFEFIRDDFKDKYVFIGVRDTASGIKDNIKSPLLGKIPGVFMHANIVDNILQKDFIKKISYPITILIMFLLTVATGITVLGIKKPLVSILSGIVYCLYFIVPFILFKECKLLMDFFYTESAIFVTFGLALAYQFIVVDRNKRKISNTFSNYLAPQVLNELLSDPSKIKLGGKKKEISILFSDIRGFTTISERSTPEEVVEFLNQFFDAMVEEIMKTGGTVDKFIGDAIMAFWGAPKEFDNHAELAIKGALGMAEALKNLKERWAVEGKDVPEINIGIGVNTGEAIVGNVGSSKIKSYTVIGDSVNLASRLEGLNKRYEHLGCPDKCIIISEFTYEHVKDIFEVEYLDKVNVKGKEIPVKIYKILGAKKEDNSE